MSSHHAGLFLCFLVLAAIVVAVLVVVAF